MSKRWVTLAGLLLVLVPWGSGGRDWVAVLVSVFGLAIAGFLLMRRPEVKVAASVVLGAIATLWLVWGAASLIWTVNRYQSEVWLLYALVATIVFLLAAELTAGEKRLVLIGYTWIATLVAVYGLFLYYTADYDRLTSSFYWANPAAAFLMPAIIVLAWRFVASKRWLEGAQLLVVASAFCLTDSRGAVLALAVALAAALLAPSVRRRWAWMVAIAVLSFSASWGLAALRTHFLHVSVVNPGSRYAEAAQGESTSVHDRLSYLQDAVAIWRDHPLLGSGAGTFGTVHPQYQRSVTTATSDAHNIFAQTLAEQGLIGALILIYLLLVAVVGVGRGVRRDPAMAPTALGALALAVHFGLDIDDRYPSLIALLALLIGLSYRPLIERLADRRHQLRLGLLVLVAVVIAVSAYRSDAFNQNGRIYDDNHRLTEAAASYAAAHGGLVYDPDTWTAEGIDDYTIASITGGSRQYTPLAESRAYAAIDRDPRDSQHYFLLARAQRLDGKLDAAISSYRQALTLDHWNHAEYYADLAGTLLQKGDRAGARQVIDQALALYTAPVIANRNADSHLKPAVAQLKQLRALANP